MDTIITFCKENFDFISLFVGFAGIIVGVVSVIQAKKEKKNNIRQSIAEMQAELDALDSVHHFTDSTSMGNTMVRRKVLQNKIAELKKQL